MTAPGHSGVRALGGPCRLYGRARWRRPAPGLEWVTPRFVHKYGHAEPRARCVHLLVARYVRVDMVTFENAIVHRPGDAPCQGARAY